MADSLDVLDKLSISARDGSAVDVTCVTMEVPDVLGVDISTEGTNVTCTWPERRQPYTNANVRIKDIITIGLVLY